MQRFVSPNFCPVNKQNGVRVVRYVADGCARTERKKERKKEISRMLERKNKNEKKRYARSGNGRLVVGGLHADVLVVFRQTWFFIVVVVVVVVGHDDFRTTTTT